MRSVSVPSPSSQGLLGAWNTRAVCVRCGEEIFHHRQLVVDGDAVCRACASDEDARADD